MFMNFRRIHKYQFVQLLATALVLSVLMVSWEELDHHVVSHVKSYTYRYMINSYDFLNSSFTITANHPHGTGRFRNVGGALVNYPYLINHPKKCEARDGKNWDDIFLLLFVKSSPESFERRQAIRETWGNESFVWSKLGVRVSLLFPIGVHSDVRQRSEIQSRLLKEDKIYGDLIQRNFVDTFHNLTNKLILQFHWSQNYCPKAQFVMSADDDVFVHMPNLVKYLQHLLTSQSGTKDLWVGHVHRGSPPNRRKDSKYHVPYAMYPWPSYPDYTAGAGYVVSGDVAAKIYKATLVMNSSMYIDDVFMGICASAMGVYPQGHVYFSGEAKTPYHSCIYDHMITSHGHAADMRSLWQAATADRNPTGFMGNVYCTAVRMVLLCLPYFQNTYSCFAAFT
ncbi:lactosylceramide 1,3-N-acetyl-beta-D-glucosaminyltransferase A [Mugil cephalus]|uniref:lactosylceramide 1,3-N-acetyl-beta-D-glucosaminyltransferase A n=1 Tax=Mugil cephalus TaxID=48193 RepID=UPI001FB77109|nr:lactosylceramide 1,3-N-acetyl-beta-D-glucosaminyltransferase A [Mugil cephalus]